MTAFDLVEVSATAVGTENLIRRVVLGQSPLLNRR
jgi:hypothetical protein